MKKTTVTLPSNYHHSPCCRPKSCAIPRSRSDFTYVGLTPNEKRHTVDFTHLLPQFHREPPSGYSRLTDSTLPIVHQPTQDLRSVTYGRLCRSSTGGNIPNYVTGSAEVSRSQSMRSLRRSLDFGHKRPIFVPSSLWDNGYTRMHQRTVSNYTLALPEEEGDCTRLRNFSVTNKGVVNWGDSFRSRSVSCMPIPQTPLSEGETTSLVPDPALPLVPVASSSMAEVQSPFRFKVMVMGASEVGKTTLIQQFTTSEYICAFDNNNDETDDCVVTVILNGDESEMEFVDCAPLEDCPEEDEDSSSVDPQLTQLTSEGKADAYAIVYSVTNRRSYLHAKYLLSQLKAIIEEKAVILVGNKTDLVRVRAVTTNEGRSLAQEKGSKFIETSVAINHQVDELLVGILSQIRMKAKLAEKQQRVEKWRYSGYSFGKAKGLIKKLLKKACFQSKSCDNLQCL